MTRFLKDFGLGLCWVPIGLLVLVLMLGGRVLAREDRTVGPDRSGTKSEAAPVNPTPEIKPVEYARFFNQPPGGGRRPLGVDLEMAVRHAEALSASRKAERPQPAPSAKGYVVNEIVPVPPVYFLRWDYPWLPETNWVRFEVWSSINLTNWIERTNTRFRNMKLDVTAKPAEFFKVRLVLYPPNEIWWTNGEYSDWATTH